jgi:hypothetical protein
MGSNDKQKKDQNSCYHDKGSWNVLYTDRASNTRLRLNCEECGMSFERRIQRAEGPTTAAPREPTFDILGRMTWPADDNRSV